MFARPKGLCAAALAAAVVQGCGEPATQPPGQGPRELGVELTLERGQQVVLTGRDALLPVILPEAGGTRSYTFAIQYTPPGSRQAMPVGVQLNRLVDDLGASNLISGARADGTPDLVPAGGSAAGGGGQRHLTGQELFDEWHGSGEARFRAAEAGALRGLRGLDPSTAGSTARAETLAPGQILTLATPVSLEGDLQVCSNEGLIQVEVMAVGEHFAFAQDLASAVKLSDQYFAELLGQVESEVVSVSEAYFGEPRDLDGNGVVVGVVTPEVNRLGAAGFFASSDFISAEECLTSNEGEILWLVSPDPFGVHGTPVSRATVETRMIGIVAHELQHLVHASRRMLDQGGSPTSLDDPWLNEGLSHLAEEVTGFYAAGLRTGDDFGLDDLSTNEGRILFTAYHYGNMKLVYDYLSEPTQVPAFATGPVDRVDFRRARGFGYLFVRWLADTYAPGEGGMVGSPQEEALFRALAAGGGGLHQSWANIEQSLVAVTGHKFTWRELLSQYANAPAVDGIALPNVDLAPGLDISTWNLPLAYHNAVEGGYTQEFRGGFPLQPTVLSGDDIPPPGRTVYAELFPSSVLYLRIENPRQQPRMLVSLLDAAGEPFPDGTEIQISVVRLY